MVRKWKWSLLTKSVHNLQSVALSLDYAASRSAGGILCCAAVLAHAVAISQQHGCASRPQVESPQLFLSTRSENPCVGQKYFVLMAGNRGLICAGTGSIAHLGVQRAMLKAGDTSK